MELNFNRAWKELASIKIQEKQTVFPYNIKLCRPVLQHLNRSICVKICCKYGKVEKKCYALSKYKHNASDLLY